MRRGVLIAVAVFAAALGGQAGAQTFVAGQMNITTGARLLDDTTRLQYAVPRSIRARIDGTVRTTSMSVNTLCCRSDAQLLAETDLQFGGTPIVLDRPLTRAEQQRFVGTLLWVDGDILVAQPGNGLCASGRSLAQVRSLLQHRVPSGEHVYAPASPVDGQPVALFGIPTTSPYSHAGAYGAGVRIVTEQSSIAAVAADPDGIAAVAWSAARAALAAGTVCQIPISGVKATKATLRKRSYPASVQATFVVSRDHTSIAQWTIDWYLREYMHSAKTRKLLETADGRNRLLP